jgi:EAL domain-containing protein (putative c-di-GMP-specific phosphodiesterase class I)
MPNQAPTRRLLRFENADQVIADARLLADAQSSGRLQSLGDWSLGTAFHHLACWVDYGYDGAPVKVPLLIRLVMRPMKHWVLNKPMRAGARIPGVQGGTLAINSVATAESLPHLIAGFERLKSQCPTKPSPLFGKLTHAEWTALHLRHSELHLSFHSVG